MHNCEIRLTEQAENNFKSICNYMEFTLKSKKAKNNFIDAFDKKMISISKEPKSCQICEYAPLAMLKIRYAIINNYKAYYIVNESENKIEVLYIKHCLQNEENLKS